MREAGTAKIGQHRQQAAAAANIYLQCPCTAQVKLWLSAPPAAGMGGSRRQQRATMARAAGGGGSALQGMDQRGSHCVSLPMSLSGKFS